MKRSVLFPLQPAGLCQCCWKNTFSFEIYGRNGKLEISGLGGSYGVEKLKHYNFSVAPLEKTQGLNFYQSAQEWELLLLTMGVFALIIILLNYYVPFFYPMKF